MRGQVFSPMILPEGYCPHNHDVQITPWLHSEIVIFIKKKKKKRKKKLHSHKNHSLIMLQSMIFSLLNNILILFCTRKAIEIIDFFFNEILKEQITNNFTLFADSIELTI